MRVLVYSNTSWSGGNGYNGTLLDKENGQQIYKVGVMSDNMYGITEYSAAIAVWQDVSAKYGTNIEVDTSCNSLLDEEYIKKGATATNFIFVSEKYKYTLQGDLYYRVSIYNEYCEAPLIRAYHKVSTLNEEKTVKYYKDWLTKRYGNNLHYDTNKAQWMSKYL